MSSDTEGESVAVQAQSSAQSITWLVNSSAVLSHQFSFKPGILTHHLYPPVIDGDVPQPNTLALDIALP